MTPTDADRQRAREIVERYAFGNNLRKDRLADAIAAAIAAARAEGFATGWMRAKHRALDAIDIWATNGNSQEIIRLRTLIRDATEGENNGSEAALKEPGHG